jgi:hypothetical protein
MIPVPGFKDLQVRWFEIKALGFVLYGFLLYSNADQQIIEFMRGNLENLDIWSGPDTAIFLIEPPSDTWRRYVAARPDHPWHLFESADDDPDAWPPEYDLLVQNADHIMLETDVGQVSLASVLRPSYAVPYDRLEVELVREHFGLAVDEYPCVIFFPDLYGKDFVYNGMPRFPQVQDVRHYFQGLFASAAFKELLEAAKVRRGAGRA